MEGAADQMSPCCDLSLQRRTHHHLIWGDVTARHHDWQINLSWDGAERDLDAILETLCPFSHTVNYSWTEVSFSVLLLTVEVLWWMHRLFIGENHELIFPYKKSLRKEEKWILLISFIVHMINSVFQSDRMKRLGFRTLCWRILFQHHGQRRLLLLSRTPQKLRLLSISALVWQRI